VSTPDVTSHMHDKSIELVLSQIFGVEEHVEVKRKLEHQRRQDLPALAHVVEEIQSQNDHF
jgi:hypothetical protein